MTRYRRYLKFCFHIFYLLFLSFLINQRSYKIVTIKKIDRFLPDLKHILIWTNVYGIEEEGQRTVIERKCPYINCYFTRDRYMFGDLRYFDVILFNLQDVSKDSYDIPNVRTINQKYIFVANDSSENYPVCSSRYDNFFNWTWTYKMDSTVVYKFFTIFNSHGEELGTHFQWLRTMDQLNNFIKNQLHTKSKAAAIFLDKCNSRSRREEFVERLQKQLTKYNLSIDVYGDCSVLKCKKKTMSPCHYRLKKNYFFYLALEDSFAEDYITGEILHAYKNNVVPIVYGAAEYDKYLPPGSYINAMLLTEEALAKKMYEIIKNKQIFYDFFRWKNHYILEESTILDPCTLCEKLNIPNWLIHKMTYTQFRKWWHPDFERRCNRRRFFIL